MPTTRRRAPASSSRRTATCSRAHTSSPRPARAPGRTRPAKRVYVAFNDGDRVEARGRGLRPVRRRRRRAREALCAPVAAHPARQLGHAARRARRWRRSAARSATRGSLAVGVVSAVGRSIPSLTSKYFLSDAIQTDAPITHGNSGGPLLDGRGNAVGINAQIRTDNGAAEGVGFAVPINAAKRSLRGLIAAGTVSYPYVGIETNDLTPTLARHLHLPVLRGALVTTVSARQPRRTEPASGPQAATSSSSTAPRSAVAATSSSRSAA